MSIKYFKAYCVGGSKYRALPLYIVKLTKERAILISPMNIALTTSCVVQDQQNDHFKADKRDQKCTCSLQLKVDITNKFMKLLPQSFALLVGSY